MLQHVILTLLKRAADTNTTREERLQIGNQLACEVWGVKLHPEDPEPCRTAFYTECVRVLYHQTLSMRPELLPGLIVPFAALCGDRSIGTKLARVEGVIWSVWYAMHQPRILDWREMPEQAGAVFDFVWSAICRDHQESAAADREQLLAGIAVNSGDQGEESRRYAVKLAAHVFDDFVDSAHRAGLMSALPFFRMLAGRRAPGRFVADLVPTP